MKDQFEYWVGDVVFLKTDKDHNKRIVTGICIREFGVQFNLACGSTDSWHYAFEITADIDVLITTTN